MKKKSKPKREPKITAKSLMQNRKIFFSNVLVVVLCVIVGFMTMKNLESIKEKESELDNLKKVEDSMRIRNEELTTRLQMEVDDEYIERAAKEMGYRKPNSIIFHIYSE